MNKSLKCALIRFSMRKMTTLDLTVDSVVGPCQLTSVS